MHKVRNVLINKNTCNINNNNNNNNNNNIIVIRMVALQVQEEDYQMQKQACDQTPTITLFEHLEEGRHVILHIRESVDSLCRDGADTPIVRVHRKAFLTRERSRSKPFWAPSYSIPVVRYPTIPPK